MNADSRQIISVKEAFSREGWEYKHVDNSEVIEAYFDTPNGKVAITAQIFIPLNSITICAETPNAIPLSHMPVAMELFMRTNKGLSLGNLEYDLDRELSVFRISNIFSREHYDHDILIALTRMALAELDRFIPFIGTVLETRRELLKDLSIQRLLMREDLLPQTPEEGEEEEDL